LTLSVAYISRLIDDSGARLPRPAGGRRRPAWEAEPVPSKVTEPGETAHVERGAVPVQYRVDGGPLGRKPDGTMVVNNATGLARSQTSRNDVCATRLGQDERSSLHVYCLLATHPATMAPCSKAFR
jgi:hypothetical protein